MNRLAFAVFCGLVAAIVWHVFHEDRACVQRHGVLVPVEGGGVVCIQAVNQ